MRSVAPLSQSTDPITRDALAGTGEAAGVLSIVGDVGPMVIAGGVLVLLGLGAVALWRSDVSELLSSSDGAYRDSDSPSGANSSSAGVETSSPSTASAETTPDAGARSRGEDDQLSERDDQSDLDLVVEILEANDGRMRQAAIVDETEWSKSKVSMVLSEMEEDGHISKLRVGRENIVSLTGNEPEAAGSPFDDE